MAPHPFSHVPVKGPGVHIGKLDPAHLRLPAGRDRKSFASEIEGWARRAHEVLIESDPEARKALKDMEVHVHFLGPTEYARLVHDPGSTSVSSLERRSDLSNRVHVWVNAQNLSGHPSNAFPVMLYELSSNAPYLVKRTAELEASQNEEVMSLRHHADALDKSVASLGKVLDHPKFVRGGEYHKIRGLVEASRDLDRELLDETRAEMRGLN